MRSIRRGFPYLLVPLSVCLLLITSSAPSDICKWVDEHGVTHYAEKCPEGIEAEAVDIPPPPARQDVEAARVRSELLLQETRVRAEHARASPGFRSLPVERLGPLPVNQVSVFLETKAADLSYDLEDFSGQFILALRARDNLPRGSWIETRFPHPANPDIKNIVGRELRTQGATMRFRSPQSRDLKCWNYEVEVLIWRDRSRSDLLDTHRQVIQSRADLSLVRDSFEMLSAVGKYGGFCPSEHHADMDRMDARQLEELCEQEREKRLAPERARLVRQCIERGDKSKRWCQDYYEDWGSAVRSSPTTVRPALYYDLPECIAAREAREKQD